MKLNWRLKTTTLLATLVAFVLLAPQALAASRADDDSSSTGGSVFFSSATYNANENAGEFAVTIERTNPSQPEVVFYGVTLKGAQAGSNFDTIPNTMATFAAGQSTYTFYVTINDQGINGPPRMAQAYLYGASPEPLGTPNTAIINLLQNDPLAAKNPANPLGYPQTPSDGDPLQYVNWYVFGNQSTAGQVAEQYAETRPSWSSALDKFADTPGSWSYRFWMWNMPVATTAKNVEKYLADAEQAQPGTTIQISTYSLIHGACENPFAIKQRFESWINQLAQGIGNFRVVLYLEVDSLMETHCINHAQLEERLAELAYAVKTLSADPHLLIYMDAAAPNVFSTARQMANMLKQADVAQANGFFLNATHYQWLTTDIHWGQQISRMLGGKHFIVQSDDDGRGPASPKSTPNGGNCNPLGRGAGPLSWDTGYQDVDGLLWFNDPGNSDGPCHAGDPAIGKFWASYAVGLIDRSVSTITGPRYDLIKSSTDM